MNKYRKLIGQAHLLLLVPLIRLFVEKFNYFEIKKSNHKFNEPVLIIDMRIIPYSFDILIFLYRAKVELENFSVVVFFDSKYLHRGDQKWINQNNFINVLFNIVIDSLKIFRVKNFQVISSEEELSNIEKNKNIFFNSKEILNQNYLTRSKHYSLTWYIRNYQKVDLFKEPFWEKIFNDWKLKNNIKKYITIQIRNKEEDGHNRLKRVEESVIFQHAINACKKLDYDIVIMPDFYNPYPEISNERVYVFNVGPASLASRLPVYENSMANISIDQLGPFFIAFLVDKPSLIIHPINENFAAEELKGLQSVYFKKGENYQLNKKYDFNNNNFLITVNSSKPNSEVINSAISSLLP